MPEIKDDTENKVIITDSGSSIPGYGFMALFLTVQTLAYSKKFRNKIREKMII